MRSTRHAAPGALMLALALALAAPGAAAAEAGACGARYTVGQGDTLSAIATRCATTIEALLDANPEITDPGRLSIGEEIDMPGEAGDAAADSEAETGAAADAAADAGEEPGEESAEESGAGRHVVEAGDTMAGIAAALGISLEDLRAANEGVDPRALQLGQELVVPVAEDAGEVEEPAPAVDAAQAGADSTEAGDDPAQADDDPAEAGADAGSAEAGGVEGGTGAVSGGASASGDVARAAPGPAADAAPADVPRQVVAEGRIAEGTECPVLTTPDGRRYALVSQIYGLFPGEHVAIEGETIDTAFCMQGPTVRVTSLQVK